MSEITPYGFEHDVHDTLRYQHKFEPHELKHASTLFNKTLEEMGGPDALHARHFDDAMKEMEKHDEWKRLPQHKQEALTSVLRSHLKIPDKN